MSQVGLPKQKNSVAHGVMKSNKTIQQNMGVAFVSLRKQTNSVVIWVSQNKPTVCV